MLASIVEEIYSVVLGIILGIYGTVYNEKRIARKNNREI